MTENKDFTFDAVIISTNLKNCKSIDIVKQFLMSTIVSDLNYPNEYSLSFKHSLKTGNKTRMQILLFRYISFTAKC